MRIWVPVMVIVLGITTLVVLGIYHGAIPELQVHQVLAGAEPGRKIKMHGKIAAIHQDFRPLRFTVRDKDDSKAVLVVSVTVDDTRPDIFKVENDVAVEGVFDPRTGTLAGTRIYTKCPSKYEASPEPQSNAAPPAAVNTAGT